jgi:hypothetical protein
MRGISAAVAGTAMDHNAAVDSTARNRSLGALAVALRII